MPKKKPVPDTSDRHRSGFMVRLPESYREVVRGISRENRRTITGEVLNALDDYIRKQGKTPPPQA